MRIQSVYVFVKLAENNCDFGISKILGIPRSSMWASITDLEKTLGKKLIHRKKQNVSFTPEGEEFIPYARTIYETFEESLAASIDGHETDVGGDVIISATQAFALGWPVTNINELWGQFPNVRLHITASDSLSKEEANASDVLIRPFPDSEVFRKVWYASYHHGLFASAEYLAKHGTPTSPEDLLSHRIIGYGDHEFSYFEDINWHLRGHSYGLPRLKPSITINSTRAIFDAACQGLGICSTPVEANTSYTGTLVRIFPDIIGPTCKVFFCIKKTATGRKLNSINAVKDYFEVYLRQNRVPVHMVEDE